MYKIFSTLRIKDQMKGLFLGLTNICTNFLKLASIIKKRSEYQALSLDWSMVSADIEVAMNKYGGLKNEKSSKS